MKHSEEWYTCDRCGCRINDVPENRRHINIFRSPKIFNLDVETVELTGYVSEEHLVGEKVLSATITEFYNDQNKQIHLCEKCRKDFERFMKNA